MLKPKGQLLIYDANWHLHFFDEAKAREAFIAECGDPHENDGASGVDFKEMEIAAQKLPLSMVSRPEWDVSVLSSLGYEIVYSEVDKPEDKLKRGDKTSSCYYCTFMVVAKKHTTQYCNGG
jgi:hypothetical protein